MNIAIWIAIALVCFVLPTTNLTSGGNRYPQSSKLAQYADHVGLPLPEGVVTPVVERLRRRQRGMMIGGITGIVLATMIYILFFENNDGTAPALVIFLTAAGTAFGGAWAIARHKPSGKTQQPVVARMRSVSLSDYLARGERIGFWMAPTVIAAGAIAGLALLATLPHVVPHASGLGVGLAVAGMLTWCVAYLALRKVLAAPARSSSELELAWDDAERADGLRQVVNLSVALTCLSLLFWLIFVGQTILLGEFYRHDVRLAGIMTGASLAIYGGLIIAVSAGPVVSWITGARKGYEQRQLWPAGVSA